MANVYASDEELLRDYDKLSLEYKNKAGHFIKNLMKVQRAEQGITAQLFKFSRKKSLHMDTANRKLHCSFCGKSEDDATKMIAASNAFICDECVALCSEILEDKLEPQGE